MAVYKVLQDIEAEDKLLGPLTLKGFIYVVIAAFLGFINFKIILSTELGYFRFLLLLLFGLPMLLFVVLASPLGREQPTEVWLLSRIRFLLKPKIRIWNQSGVSQLVTITAPKKAERQLTKSYTQSEVASKLKSLAMSMDAESHVTNDIAPDITPADDILDEQNNPTAHHFGDLLKIKEAERKQELSSKVSSGVITTEPATVKAKEDTLDGLSVDQRGRPAYRLAGSEAELSRRFAAAEAAFRSEGSLDKEEPLVTAANQAAKLELAQSGNDLSVASIASLANRRPEATKASPNEVIVSLH